MSTPKRWRAFSLLAAAYFMTTVDLTIVTVSLPTIGRDLHFGDEGLQWIVTAYALTFGGFLLLGGRFADLLGRRRVFMAGLGAFAAASLGCALATGEATLIAMRGLQGLGAATMIPAALSLVMGLFDAGPERNKALGIWGGLGAGGGTVGLIAGGLIARYLGWELIFYLNVPIATAAFALAPRVVPAGGAEQGHTRFDLAGAISGTGGLVLLVFAISKAPHYGWGSATAIGLLAASVAVLAAFGAIERRAADPLLPLSFLRFRSIAGANLAALLLGASWFAFVFAGTLFMQQVLAFSALQTGLAWLAASVTSMALAGVSQHLVTRIGAGPVMAIGMSMIGVSILWTTLAPADGGFLANLAEPFVLGGAGTAFSFIPISVAALDGVGESRSGLASGLLNTTTQVGAAIGTAIASSVAAAGTAGALRAGDPKPLALASGFHQTFWVLGAVALIALPAIFGLVRRSGSPEPAAKPSRPAARGERKGSRHAVAAG
jgi:EmrB/QacA subfamily drug resistance transporter